MEIINILGYKLSKSINISPPAARELLKLAIKDEVGPFKPLEQLTYNDFMNAMQNALKHRLIKLEVKNLDEIIDFMIKELNENQSLLTISKV